MSDRTFKEIQSIVYEEYTKNGYLEEWTNGFMNSKNRITKKFDIAELGLIVTEVSEAMEEIRNDEKYNEHDDIFIECADIIIRTLNFMSRHGVNAEYYILYKHNKNLERGLLHGKQV